MSSENSFKERYKSNDTPWDIGRPDSNLIQVVTKTPIAPCKALELGCGTGDNAIWLSRQGFDVTAVDSSEIAIERARRKALGAGIRCTFTVASILADKIQGPPFGFAFDRGFFHTLASGGERGRFAEILHRQLQDGGLWLSLIGNCDEKREGHGPPQRSAAEIVIAVEPCFEILSLAAGHFDSNAPVPPLAWICLSRKRASP